MVFYQRAIFFCSIADRWVPRNLSTEAVHGSNFNNGMCEQPRLGSVKLSAFSVLCQHWSLYTGRRVSTCSQQMPCSDHDSTRVHVNWFCNALIKNNPIYYKDVPDKPNKNQKVFEPILITVCQLTNKRGATSDTRCHPVQTLGPKRLQIVEQLNNKSHCNSMKL